MNSLVVELQSKYPGHILPTNDIQWTFINTAGWMASICILHASLTEYVALFGTAMDTSGHSGKLEKIKFGKNVKPFIIYTDMDVVVKDLLI